MQTETIRQFIEAMDWITPDNASYLIDGTFSPQHYDKWQKKLEVMTKTKKSELALKKVVNDNSNVAYALRTNGLNRLTYFKYWHDRKLRNCIARLIYDHGNGWLGLSELHGFADFQTDTPFGKFYFEFDNNTMNDDKLIDKIKSHYSGEGKYRVIFFMGHRIPELEQKRLEKLFEIVKNTLPSKKGRILGACYSQYLKDGKFYDWRNECNTF